MHRDTAHTQLALGCSVDGYSTQRMCRDAVCMGHSMHRGTACMGTACTEMHCTQEHSTHRDTARTQCMLCAQGCHTRRTTTCTGLQRAKLRGEHRDVAYTHRARAHTQLAHGHSVHEDVGSFCVHI